MSGGRAIAGALPLCFREWRRTASQRWLTNRVSIELTVWRPWFSVQPTGISTMSLPRRTFSSWARTVVWM